MHFSIAAPAYPFRNLVFQGGGIKALAYHGAVQVLEEGGIMGQFERVGGTSAGALLAAFLSMRLELADIVEIYRSFDHEKLTLAHSGHMPVRNRANGALLRRLERIRISISAVNRLLTRFGWYGIEYAYEWMRDVLAQGCHGVRDATFAQFSDWGFRDLHIVVTNVTTRTTEIFCAANTPDVAVADALLITQAIPLYFEALQFDGSRFGRGDHYSDGGILLNYPLPIFDERPFARNNRWFVNGVNWETLGSRLYTPADCPVRPARISNLLSYTQNILESLLLSQAVSYELSKTAQRRTINISDCCVRTTERGIRPDPDNARYRELFAAGQSAAADYLAHYKPPLIKPLLPFTLYLDRWRRRLGRPTG